MTVGLFIGALLGGRSGLRRIPPALAMLVGLAILLLIGLIPYLGAVLDFIAVLVGLGALILTAVRAGRGTAVSTGRPM